jgi:hypothetical protein
MDDLSQRISRMMEDEVERRVAARVNALTLEYNEKLDGYINYVAKHHGISKDLLLRDVPEFTDRFRCKGVKKDGVRCTRRGTHEGYCTLHLYQKVKLQPVIVQHGMTSHTHGMEVLYEPTCQACQEQDKKKLIDLNSILFNE